MGGIMGGGDGGAKKAARAATSAANTAADATLDASGQYSQSIGQATEPYAQSILRGSQMSADSQREALQYLQNADQLPSAIRDQALQKLANTFNADADVTQSITDRALNSNLYKNSVQQGENAVLRNASATGGLRSGNASDALAGVNQNAFANAYGTSYNEYMDQVRGIQGLASLPSNANNIAGYISGVGNTLGQGQISSAQALSQGQLQSAQALYQGQNDANTFRTQGSQAAAQTKAQGAQNESNNTASLIGLGLTAAMMFSDRRLKTNVVLTGEESGLRKYRWTWNKLAARLGLRGKGYGVMADEVETLHPDAVSVRDGFKVVDYAKLGVSHGV